MDQANTPQKQMAIPLILAIWELVWSNPPTTEQTWNGSGVFVNNYLIPQTAHICSRMLFANADAA